MQVSLHYKILIQSYNYVHLSVWAKFMVKFKVNRENVIWLTLILSVRYQRIILLYLFEGN